MRTTIRMLGVAAMLWLGFAASGAAQDYQNFTLGAGFMPDPQTGTGTTGGAVDAAARGDGCVGMIDEVPDHVITVTSALGLRATVRSGVDSTLVIRGPAGTFCDDDSAGALDAEVVARLTPGDYEVYVGDLGGSSGRYTLSLSEDFGAGGAAAATGAEESGPRTFELGAGFTPDPQIGRGITGGDMDAARFGEGCTGSIHVQPDHVMTVTSQVDLHIIVESDVDATLVIVGPGSNRCDDDSAGGLDPAIRGRFAPGIYQIYIGNLGDEQGRYRLSITEDFDIAI